MLVGGGALLVGGGALLVGGGALLVGGGASSRKSPIVMVMEPQACSRFCPFALIFLRIEEGGEGGEGAD